MRQRIDKSTLILARSYLLNPQEHWGPNASRHVRKLTSAMGRALRPGERIIELVDEILAVARIRTAHAPPPIYLPNSGSCGSHWLEAMLSLAAGTIACGEVYLPKPILKQLSGLSPACAGYFLNAAHVAHSGNIGPALVEGHCVNSAHITNVGRIAALTPGAKKVLLVRDPIDVVISRTLRKPAHRADVAPDMDDLTYLMRNCEFVERFHAAVENEAFDGIARYEDLVNRPVEALTALTSALGLSATSESIRSAVESTSRSAVEQTRAQGIEVAINLYSGAVRTDARLEARARQRLMGLCRRLGYAVDGAAALG
jgi:Sulfotransferase family